MQFLDLDLDFFLDDITYGGNSDSERLGSEYKPWSISRVRRFLENRCGLSFEQPVPGRTVYDHDEIFDFWSELIKSTRLQAPFEVTHVDAHSDLWLGGGIYMVSEFLHINVEDRLVRLKREKVDSGNYLAFALACRWVKSLVWVPLRKNFDDLPSWDFNRKSSLIQMKKRECINGLPIRDLPVVGSEPAIPLKIIPWRQFTAQGPFKYLGLSRSPSFTPLDSDELVPVIEEYMTKI
ncbi:UPF0489 family protein [Chloroflexota bacterium]